MKTRRSAKADRPIDAATLRRAREIASRYRMLIEPSRASGYIGRTVEMSGVIAGGETVEECARRTLEAQTVAVAVYLEDGERPPAPSVEGARGAQVNIRMTIDEKLTLESAAQRQGFRNLSEFLRTAGLRSASAA